MSAEQDTIRDLAYRLWQDAGGPHGRDQEFWYAAEAQVSAAPAEVAPKAAKPKAPAKPKAAPKAEPKPKEKAPAKPKAAPKTKAAAKA